MSSLRAEVARSWWASVDALIVPTVARVPTFAEAMTDRFGPSLELGRLTAFVNPLGLAAVAVPAGTRAGGLPFGVSLVGPGGSDHDLLALGYRLFKCEGETEYRGETLQPADLTRWTHFDLFAVPEEHI